MRVLLVVALVVVVFAAGATAVAEPSAPVRHQVVTACTKAETRSALVSFLHAFNAGDSGRLNTSFAGPSWFRWYSSSTPGVRFDPQAQQRSTLIGYFRGRHAQRDRLELVWFLFHGNGNGFGNFSLKLRRSAADWQNGAWFVTEAKGAALCQGSKVQFVVMSIGSPEP